MYFFQYNSLKREGWLCFKVTCCFTVAMSGAKVLNRRVSLHTRKIKVFLKQIDFYRNLDLENEEATNSLNPWLEQGSEGPVPGPVLV